MGRSDAAAPDEARADVGMFAGTLDSLDAPVSRASAAPAAPGASRPGDGDEGRERGEKLEVQRGFVLRGGGGQLLLALLICLGHAADQLDPRALRLDHLARYAVGLQDCVEQRI